MTPPPDLPDPDARPRVLRVDLARLGDEPSAGWRLEPWRHARADLDRVGAWSGAALGLAVVADAVLERGALPPLVLSAGESVRKGLPTAVRASVASIGPMSGTYAEGQVGGDLGSRLARVADALVLERSAGAPPDGPGAVLEVGPDRAGDVRVALHRGALAAELAGLSPVETGRRLRERFGDSACVRVGPAAERGVPFASLAVGGDEPSFVGRGGLGHVFAALGLKALVLTAEPVDAADPAGAARLLRALSRSPRLATRSESGTLELWHAFASRGDLHGRDHAERLDASEGARLSREARGAAREQRGCRGCPTPCGWVFDAPGGKRQHGTFSATYAVGPNLGLEGFEDALALLAACDTAGVDAVETGAALGRLARAGRVPFGDRDAFAEAIAAIGTDHPVGGPLALGASRRAPGEREGEDRGFVHRGESARPEGDLAAVLAQCVSAAGADPMRTFPFLTDGGADAERALRALLPEEAAGEGRALRAVLDPLRAAGKGRLVWAYENWKAAVDTTGFCAFSAAGLLADGVLGLDELAEAIEPEGLRALRAGADPDWAGVAAGAALLALGASVVLMRHALRARLDPGPDALRPAWAREAVDRPGMLDEYRAARGLDGRGAPSADALARIGTPRAARPVGALAAVAAAGAATGPEPPADGGRPDPAGGPAGGGSGRGSVELRAVGPLSEALGPARRVELPLPAALAEVLAAASRSNPRAARYLLRDGRAVPAVYRGGRRVAEDEPVRDGDVLDLVVAIRGG